MMPERSQPTYNPADTAALQCPYPHFDRLRIEAPATKIEGGDYFFLSRFADIKDVLMRPGDFSSEMSDAFDGVGEVFIPEPVLNMSDPPVHSRTKAIARQFFLPTQVNAMTDRITEIVDGLIDGFIDRGQVELVREFAMPLPMTVIAELLGIPSADRAIFKRWSDEMLVIVSPLATVDDIAKAKLSLKDANAYLLERLRARRDVPTGDILSSLAAAMQHGPAEGERGHHITEGEALSIIQLLLLGGNETTTNAIVNGFVLLSKNPQVIEDIREERAAWPEVIEEFLRMESPSRGFFRKATRDTMIGDVAIPAGSLVFVSYASANRDPEQFECPAELRPDRKGLRGHVAFGLGIHACIGSHLARKELTIAFDRLFARLPNLRLASGMNDMDNIFVPNALVRGIAELHLSFGDAA